MPPLRKHDASAEQLSAVSADALAYDDDVTPEGIAEVRARVAARRPARTFKVIDGFVGAPASAPDAAPAVG